MCNRRATRQSIAFVATAYLRRQLQNAIGLIEQDLEAGIAYGFKVLAIIFARKREDGLKAIAILERNYSTELVRSFSKGGHEGRYDWRFVEQPWMPIP